MRAFFAFILPVLTTCLGNQEPQKPIPMGEHHEGAQNPLDDGDFRHFVESQLDKWRVPGMTIAVIDGDQTWAEVSNIWALQPASSTLDVAIEALTLPRAMACRLFLRPP